MVVNDHQRVFHGGCMGGSRKDETRLRKEVGGREVCGGGKDFERGRETFFPICFLGFPLQIKMRDLPLC